jgi:hypothetical protein
MEKFWCAQSKDSDGREQEGVFDAAAGDEVSGQFWFRVEGHAPGARRLRGRLVFPERTEVSIFHGSLTQLRELCLRTTARGVIHDKRFEHWT